MAGIAFLTLLFLISSRTALAQSSSGKSFSDLLTDVTQVIPVSPLSMPALHQTFIDPDFGTQITKVTHPSQVNNIGTAVRQDYAKAEPFNANNTYAIFRVIGDGSWWLYETATWNPIRSIDISQGEPELRWSPTDPDTVYYVDREYFGAYHPSTNTFQTIHQFTQCNYSPGNNYYALTGQDESNLSTDGTRIAWLCRKSGGVNSVITYDIPNDRILYEGTLPVALADMDWVSISPSGKYFVIMTDSQWTRVYDAATGVFQRVLQNFGHADMGWDASGNEVIVVDGADDPTPHTCSFDTGDGCRWIVKYNLATGARTDVFPIRWEQGMHLSMRATDRPGWVLVSVPFGTSSRWSATKPNQFYPPNFPVVDPLDFEIFYANLDGSQQIKRVAHTRSVRADNLSMDEYWNEPHAVADKTGNLILFASPWVANGVAMDNVGGVMSQNSYLITLAGGTSASCNTVTTTNFSQAAYNSYGAPFDAFQTGTNLLDAKCNSADAHTINLTTGVTGDTTRIVYTKGYYYDPVTAGWTQYSGTCNGALNGEWCQGSISATITNPNISTASASNPAYLVGMTCSVQNGSWRCGCRDTTCANFYWQVQGAGQ